MERTKRSRAIAPDVRAIFCRRHQTGRTPLAKIRPVSPVPAMGPGHSTPIRPSRRVGEAPEVFLRWRAGRSVPNSHRQDTTGTKVPGAAPRATSNSIFEPAPMPRTVLARSLVRLASKSKCLAQMNKSRTGASDQKREIRQPGLIRWVQIIARRRW